MNKMNWKATMIFNTALAIVGMLILPLSGFMTFAGSSQFAFYIIFATWLVMTLERKS